MHRAAPNLDSPDDSRIGVNIGAFPAFLQGCRVREAAMMALEEYKIRVEHAKPGSGIFPFSMYLHHQLAMLKAIEEDDLTPDRLRKIAVANQALIAATVELEREFLATKQRDKNTAGQT